MTHKIIRRVERLANQVKGETHISARNVPYVVVQISSDSKASICYFGRTNKWRVFYPYGVHGDQSKTDCRTTQDVEIAINNLRLEVVEEFNEGETK